MSALRFFLCLLVISCFMMGCGGTYQYRLEKIEPVQPAKTLPGTVNLKSDGIQEVYHHELGFHKYELYVKDAVVKQFRDSLARCFADGIKDEQADVNIVVTALDTSTFPIGSIINDVRLFFRVEIFDQKMNLQKTTTIYGFGSSENGNRAMEKAVSNAFKQLLPLLEEMYIRE